MLGLRSSLKEDLTADTPEALAALLRHFETAEDACALTHVEIGEILHLAQECGMEESDNRGLAFVARENRNRLGDAANKRSQWEAERNRIGMKFGEYVRGGVDTLRYGAASLFDGFAAQFMGEKNPPRERRQMTSGSETLERRRYLSAAEVQIVPNVVLDTSFDTSAEFTDAFTPVRTTMDRGDEGVTDGHLTLDNRILELSKEDFMPSAEKPVTIESEFSLKATPDSVIVATRSDGVTMGRGQSEFRNALVGLVEKDGAVVYLYRTVDGQDQGQYVKRYVTFPAPLTPGKTYQMTFTDAGTHASLVVKDGDTVLADLSGDVTPEALGTKIMLVDGEYNRSAGVTLNALKITHGTKEIAPEVVSVPEASPLEAAAVDAVFADPGLAERVDQALSQNAQNAESLPIEEITNEPSTLPAITVDMTPEERLAAFAEKTRQLDAQIATLQGTMSDIDERIGEENAEMQSLNDQMTQAQTILDHRAQQEGAESQRVTPVISVETKRLDPTLYVDIQNMPAGYHLTLTERGQGEFYALPEGNASLRFDLPRFGAFGTTEVVLVNANGDVVASLRRFIHTDGRGAAKTGAGTDSTTLTSLAHVPGLAEADMVSDAQYAAAVADMRDAEAELAECQGELAELGSEKVSVQEAINTLSRQEVPYARMQATINAQGTYTIRYASPYAQSYFVMTQPGLNGEWQRHLMEHAAGMQDGTFEFNPSRGVSENRGFLLSMYSDQNKTVLLDQFSGSVDNISGKVKGQSVGDRDDLATGRMIDTPIASEITVLDIQGTRILVGYSSPENGGTIMLAGGGVLSTNDFDYEGGTTGDVGLLTFNTDNTPGNYPISLCGGPNGRVLSTEILHWDGTTLTAESGIGTMDFGGDEEMAEASRTMQDQGAIDDIFIGNRILALVQRTHLYECSDFYIDDSQFDVIARQYRIGPHPDAGGIARELLGVYETGMGEVLEKAANVAVTAWNSGSQRQAIAAFDASYSFWSTHFKIGALAVDFGVRFPSHDAVFEEGIRLAQCQVNGFVANRMKYEKLLIQANERANQVGPEDDPTKEKISEAARLHNAMIVASLFGLQSPQYVAFTTAWGDPGIPRDGSVVVQLNGDITSADGTVIQHVELHAAATTDGPMVLGDNTVMRGFFLGVGQSKVDTETVKLEAGKTSSITFTLDETKMVNFSVDTSKMGFTGGMAMPVHPNIAIDLTGSSLNGKTYLSDHSQDSGESISYMLSAGIYTLTIRDATNYGSLSAGARAALHLPEIHVDTNIKPYNSANIEGVVSIDKNALVMPVSMKVAAFDASGKRVDRDPITGKELTLDANKPVWVVIHGRNDNENSGKMQELAKALIESGYQVVTIDWSKAAGSNIPESVGMQGEAWIQAVADWSYLALTSAQVEGGNVRMGVHSWGSFVGFAIAEHFKSENGIGVDTIVALDSARDPTLAWRYDASQVNFAAVSNTSTAFHSSFWGSEGRANTADHTIEIRPPLASGIPWEDTTLKHGLAVTTFANLIRLQKIDPTNALASLFSFKGSKASSLPVRNGIDGWLYVKSQLKSGSVPNDNYIDAIPTKMTLTNPDDNVVDSYVFNTLHNVQSTITQ